jgi:hypothetical protein
MTKTEFDHKQQELDRLLNDPEIPMRPDRIWALAEALSRARPQPQRRDA